MSLPRPALRLLAWLVRDPIVRAGLLGDLEERWERVRLRGRLRRAVWLAGELLSAARHYGPWRGRRSGRRAPPRPALRLLADFTADLRTSARTLFGRDRLFTASVVTTLALGIGSTTVILSVVDGLLLEPLPFERPDRLALLWQTDPATGASEPAAGADFADFRERSGAFETLAAYRSGPVNVAPEDDFPRRAEAAWVTPGLPEALGVAPLLGPGFTPGSAEGPPEVLLSWRFWRASFSADPEAVGRELVVQGTPHRIAGVLPAEVAFPARGTDLWIALRAAWDPTVRRPHDLILLGRLAPGVTLEAAGRELDRVAAELVAEYGNEGRGARLQPLEDHLRGDLTPALRPLFAGAGLLFLLACLRAANLSVARGGSRLASVSVRAALGASRGRLLRLFLAEGLLLAGLASALGVGLTRAGLPVFLGLVPDALLGVGSVEVDGTVLAVACGLGVAVAVGFAVLPLLQLRQRAPASVLGSDASARAGSAAPSAVLARQALVGVHLALALLLLVPAILLAGTLWQLGRVDPGFEAENRLRVSYTLPDAYREGSSWPDWPRVIGFNRALAAEVGALPGVLAAAVARDQPLAPGVTNSYEVVGGPAPPEEEPRAEIPIRFVSSGYFEAAGLAFVEGEGFGAGDYPDAPPRMVLNEAARSALFPGGGAAVGARIRAMSPTFVVTGIVHNERFYGLREAEPPAMYVDLGRIPPGAGSFTLLVHTAGDPEALVRPVREVFRGLDPDLATFDVRTMEETLAESVARERFASLVLSVFAAAALLLAALGVYGLMSFLASARRHELGVRMALGADPRLVRRLLVSGALPMILAGTAAGLLGAWALTKSLSSLLYGVDPLAPAWYAAPAAALVLVAVVACLLPAIRASRLDPARALFPDRR